MWKWCATLTFASSRRRFCTMWTRIRTVGLPPIILTFGGKPSTEASNTDWERCNPKRTSSEWTRWNATTTRLASPESLTASPSGPGISLVSKTNNGADRLGLFLLLPSLLIGQTTFWEVFTTKSKVFADTGSSQRVRRKCNWAPKTYCHVFQEGRGVKEDVWIGRGLLSENMGKF